MEEAELLEKLSKTDCHLHVIQPDSNIEGESSSL
jgi:hypothetical protein